MAQKVKLDSGIEYEAPAEVVVAFDKLRKDAADEKTKNDAAAAKHATDLAAANTRADTEKARADQAIADLTKAKTDSAAEIGPKVAARVALLDSARRVLGDKLKTDSSDRDVMVAAIVEKNKDFKADGLTDDYVRARYDAVIEGLGKQADASQRKQANSKADGDDTQDKTDSKDARQRYLDRLNKTKAAA